MFQTLPHSGGKISPLTVSKMYFETEGKNNSWGTKNQDKLSVTIQQTNQGNQFTHLHSVVKNISLHWCISSDSSKAMPDFQLSKKTTWLFI